MMKLSSLIEKDLIKIGAKAADKKSAIACVLDEMAKTKIKHEQKSNIMKAIEDRESLGETTFPSGIAVPHARLEDFEDLLIGICVPETPFMDGGILVRMVVVILTGKASSNLYLQTLAAFMRVSQDEPKFEKLTACQSRTEILKELETVIVKKEITVVDIMQKDFPSVKPETTVREVADIFAKNNISYLPVLDDTDKPVGEITMTELLRIGIPNYAMMIGNLKFLTNFEPFEDFLRNEDKILVRDIMLKQSVVLKEETSVIEAALEFVKLHRRYLSVVKDNKISGVIDFMDILQKVIRG